MTNESSPSLGRRFVRDGLPWVIGAGALVVYLASLHHWVALSSLGHVSRVNGWDWAPTLSQPLMSLLTYPFGWLPEAWVPVTLNGFTAVCAALTLSLLARSVALLPHDRLEQQRLLVGNEPALFSAPDAWVPVVLASAALGLQLTFWEHSIAASGEMLDLLLVAYCVRCLLEHRVDQRDRWLDRASLVFGVAMANNWAMVGFLPLFVVALLRTKRFRFFNLRFLRRLEQSMQGDIGPRLRQDLRFGLRMALLGLGGLSLFVVVPLTQSLSPDSALSLGQALQATAASYNNNLHLVGRVFFRYRREVGLLLAAVSLLPVLLLSIRWRAFAGGGSNQRFDLASWILNAAHAFLLLICLAALFDPPFSPRQIGGRTGLPWPFLPLYYLAALSVGYYSGFFLLLFGAGAVQRLSHRFRIRRQLCWAVPKLLYALAGLALVGLWLKNLPVIRAARAPYLERYARRVASSLPPGAVVLSEDAIRLSLFQAALASEGRARGYLPVVTRALGQVKYRGWLQKKYPGRWRQFDAEVMPGSPGTNAPLDALRLVRLVSSLARSNSVYCLQANPGLLLEQVYLQPHGLAHEMRTYPTNSLGGPPLAAAEVAENQDFWHRAIEQDVQPLSRLATRTELPRSEVEQWLMRLGRLNTPPPVQLKVLAVWYSSALNTWGAALQRGDHWQEATPYFTLAAELNPNNLAARINLLCNSNQLAHQRMTLVQDPPFREQFEKYRDGTQILAENGPLDEPNYCYLLSSGLARVGMLRQAAQQLDRASTLAPGDILPRLVLGGLYARCMMPDQTLRITDNIRNDPQFQPLSPTNAVDVSLLEAEAWYAKTNRAKAEATLEALLTAQSANPLVWDRAGAVFAAHQSYSNALRVVRQQLQAAPDSVPTLINLGTLFTVMGDFSNAIPPLTRALALTNNYAARLSRAFVYFRAGSLDEAEADCKELLRAFPNAYGTYHLLGEVAWQRKDTNAAVGYFKQFLASAKPDTPEARTVVARLKSLHQQP